MTSKSKSKGGKKQRDINRGAAGSKRDLLLKEEGQEYATITRMLGNSRVECHLCEGGNAMGRIRGGMRGRVWINQGDIVLVGVKEFQKDKVDILHKYLPDEARELKKLGEIPKDAQISEGLSNIVPCIEFVGEESEEEEGRPQQEINFSTL